MTPKERRAVARWLIHMILILVVGLLIMGNQAQIAKAQEDTLNTINDMRIEMNSQTLEPATEEPPEAKIEPMALTAKERDLVCRIVAAEARGEDLQGQMAVAQVIKDRSDLWGMTVTDVVLAPGQFAAPYKGKIPDEIRLAVANVFDGGVRVFEEPVTHFHAEYVDPDWTSGKTSRGKVGSHEFWN